MNPFRSLFYLARRFKKETAMNFMGLTVAFAACYLMLTQIDYNRNFNRCIPDGERVMRLETMGTINSNRILNAIIAKMPQVEGVSEMLDVVYWDEFRNGENVVGHSSMHACLTPFGAMGARCLDGSLQWNDYGERTVIIPASIARRLYDGRTEVAGEPIVWNGDKMRVLGVYEDFPENCSIKNHIYFNDAQYLNDWINWNQVLYVKLRADVDAEAFQHDFAQLLKPLIWKENWKMALASGEVTADMEQEMRGQFEQSYAGYAFNLRPVYDVWFSGVDYRDKGSRSMLLVLQIACLLVIMIASVNFLNFALAESPMRVRSINIRRILGEGVWSLRLGLIAETVVTALMALGTALVVCIAVAQRPSGLLLGNTSLSAQPWLGVMMVVLAVAVGIAVGVYPAFFSTSFQPALTLKGSFGLTPKGRRLRSILVVLQLGISLFLLVFISIMLMQSYYIYRSDYGYEKDEVLCAQLPDQMEPLKGEIRDELMRLDGVANVSYSRFMLGTLDCYVIWSGQDDEHQTMLVYTCLYVDCNYLRTMGIKVIEGRDFNEHDGYCCIINETAKRQWPWIEVGKNFLSDDSLAVVGVCENIRYASVRKDRQQPMAFAILDEKYAEWGDQLGLLNVRIGKEADKSVVRQQVQDLLNRKSGGNEVKVQFLDEQIEQLYQDERRSIRQMLSITALCVIITLTGLSCMVMFETEYRRKEIGIRKVMGATFGEIILLFCRRYAWLLAVSFLVAAPLAWYVGRAWLQSFAEHATLSWWIFPLALMAVSIASLATVILQSWHAANEHPVNSIKNE